MDFWNVLNKDITDYTITCEVGKRNKKLNKYGREVNTLSYVMFPRPTNPSKYVESYRAELTSKMQDVHEKARSTLKTYLGI